MILALGQTTMANKIYLLIITFLVRVIKLVNIELLLCGFQSFLRDNYSIIPRISLEDT